MGWDALAGTIDPEIARSVPLLANLAAAERAAILTNASLKAYAAGDVVFEQGAEASHFFILVSGRLRVHQVTPEGQQIIVRMVNPGDLFGIAKALSRPDYPGTATAAQDSSAIVWPMRVWDSLMAEHPTLAINTMQTVGQRLQEAQTRMREMATEEVERRVAHTVLRLTQQSGRKEAGGIRIDFPITRQDIAEMTGTTLHTVSRILSAWEGEGLVEGGRQKLLVRDPHKLLLIADGLMAPRR